ncbi:hypothetical protein VSU19_14290 [Verrucomicrobiales bacterium BCK34]|nr:hypothetical protein [Verrucomicrobiales bacterium BCK34]
MKPLKLTAVILLGLTGINPTFAEPARTMKMRDAVTHDELSQRLRMTLQKDPIRNLGPAAGKTEEDPSVRTHSRDLVRDSTIISYKGNLTLVPKRAVLHIPDEITDRIGPKSGLKVLTWADFLQVNRGWIRTVEVSRDQVMGITPIQPNIVEAFAKSSSMVVATFKGGPVSVLPLKEPETTEEGESEQLNATTR